MGNSENESTRRPGAPGADQKVLTRNAGSLAGEGDEPPATKRFKISQGSEGGDSAGASATKCFEISQGSEVGAIAGVSAS